MVGTDMVCGRGREDNDLTEAENLCVALRLTKYEGPVQCYRRLWKPSSGIHLLANGFIFMPLYCGHTFHFNQVVYWFPTFSLLEHYNIYSSCFWAWLTDTLWFPSHLSFLLPSYLFEKNDTRIFVPSFWISQ